MFQLDLQRTADACKRWIKILFFIFVLAGCSQSEVNYRKNGIGADLYASNAEVLRITKLQDTYFEYLCIQAGVNLYNEYNGTERCINDRSDTAVWTLIVQQGMNDIDRRCDAYLEWLDDRKRSRGPIIAQVGAVQDTTNAILGFVTPGSRAIEIVAQAFGLITKSIDNYHDRLLLVVESSTVNSLVLNRRHNFRKETVDFVYTTKPAAEYALRSYLRICLPFAIETEINDFTTLSSKGDFRPNLKTILPVPAQNSSPSIQSHRSVEKTRSGRSVADQSTKSLVELGGEAGGIDKIISCGSGLSNIEINDAINQTEDGTDESKMKMKEDRARIVQCLKSRGQI